MSTISPQRIQAFITEWEVSGGAERGNAHSFINELCDILEVPRPDKSVPDNSQNAYVFEKTIPHPRAARISSTCTNAAVSCWNEAGADAVGVGHGRPDGNAPVSAEGEQRLKQRKTGHGIRGTPA
ncbi:MAG: hypothetical protein IPJ85_17695 [Flavobacteriales bacterium]|nr:hypothetical protein [Flavobacteriales bacterium]